MTRQDPYIAFLQYRNTPMTDSPSPPQLLFNRRLRTKLPATNNYLKPRETYQVSVSRKINKRKQQQAKYYNKMARTKPVAPLQPGDSVRTQKEPGAVWKPAIVMSQSSTPRSYVMKMEDGSRMLRKTRETFVIPQPETHEPVQNDFISTPEQEDDATTVPAKPEFTSRFGRQIHPPARYPENEWQYK